MAYKFTNADRTTSPKMCKEVDLLRQEKSKLLQSIKYWKDSSAKTEAVKKVKIDGMETRLRDIDEEERVKFHTVKASTLIATREVVTEAALHNRDTEAAIEGMDAPLEVAMESLNMTMKAVVNIKNKQKCAKRHTNRGANALDRVVKMLEPSVEGTDDAGEDAASSSVRLVLSPWATRALS